MRALIGGILGGCVAVLVLAVVGVGLLVAWQRGEPDRHRAVLLRQIDEYEAWMKVPARDFERRYQPQKVEAEREAFLLERPELRHYFRWWQSTKRAEARGLFADAYIDYAQPQDLRDPAWLDRYLATR